MAYVKGGVAGALGCGDRPCRCGGCGMGEVYEKDEDLDGYGAPARATAEARLTDALFHTRHPERRGRPIRRDEAGLAAEWRTIRDRLVRPVLRDGGLATPLGPGVRRPEPPWPQRALGPVPSPARGATGTCPIEDPLPNAARPVGTVCGADGRKCWPARGRALDLTDPDLPCTNQRSPRAYRAVLDYFNVADTGNLRYAREANHTFCNIYVHDVTRTLRASIPHWVRDPRQTRERPVGWNELNANATFDWLVREGPRAGWMPVDATLCSALHRMGVSADGSNPAIDRLPVPLAVAARRIAAARHVDPALLLQDGYVAQQFANLGFPCVIAWRNTSGRAGHLAMVRPESPGSAGVLHASGMYLPRSSQAGGENFTDRPARWIAGSEFRTRRFFIHA